MNFGTLNFLQSRRIDSFQKLQVLLFMHQNPHLCGTVQEFAQHLYFGDTTQLKNILTELQAVNLVICSGIYYKLHHEPSNNQYLHNLARDFENPLSRQVLLQELTPAAS